MRIALSIVFVILIITLALCSFFSHRSKKPIGKPVSLLLAALLMPVVGNLCLISSNVAMLSLVGCYLFFTGMNLVIVAMVRFTCDYCNLHKHEKITKIIIYGILTLDSIQILLNIFTKHVFYLEETVAFGSTYYQFVPLWGQTIHRILDYIVFAGIVITFIIKSIRAPKIYAERYLVILVSMLAVAAWQTFYIVSGASVDVSMIGFGIFGVLVFILSLFYRPLRLLDRMLGTIASKMPEAMYFFDKVGRCIWANNKGLEFLGIKSDQLDYVTSYLNGKIGGFDKDGDEWKYEYVSGEGESITGYSIEKHAVIDDKNRVVGSYISIRDITKEQRRFEEESFKAVHDPLTKAYNRAGFDKIINEVELSNIFLVLLDIDCFKETNDTYGHLVGDDVLILLVDILNKHFREKDCVCRIGGDEFAIIVMDADNETAKVVEKRIEQINKEFAASKLPTTSISAGGVYGRHFNNIKEVFAKADEALYQTKKAGKNGFTLIDN